MIWPSSSPSSAWRTDPRHTTEGDPAADAAVHKNTSSAGQTDALSGGKGGFLMDAPNDNTAFRRLRRWWLSPPRPGMQRVINPWEYCHLGVFGIMRIAGGSVAGAAGVVCLAYGVYSWAAFFLVLGALNLAGGCWYIALALSAPYRT
jgi:hypothetical protein